MNNTHLDPRKHFAQRSQPVRSAPDRQFTPTEEAIRDFFRKGDRGTYEGGPADPAFDSLPPLDLPERAPIIRTPRQKARRAVLMRFEAALLGGCVVLLVVAARMNSGGDSATQQANAAQLPAQPAARPAAVPVTQRVQPAVTRAAPATPTRVAAAAAPTPVVAPAPAPTTRSPAQVNPSVPRATIANSDRVPTNAKIALAPTPARAASIAQPVAPKATPRVERSRPAAPVVGASRAEPMPVARAAPPKAAVAAFPD